MARSIKGPEEEEENVNYGEKKTNVTLILFRFTKPENTSIHLFYLYLVWLCHAMNDKNAFFFNDFFHFNYETVFRDMLIYSVFNVHHCSLVT